MLAYIFYKQRAYLIRLDMFTQVTRSITFAKKCAFSHFLTNILPCISCSSPFTAAQVALNIAHIHDNMSTIYGSYILSVSLNNSDSCNDRISKKTKSKMHVVRRLVVSPCGDGSRIVVGGIREWSGSIGNQDGALTQRRFRCVAG